MFRVKLLVLCGVLAGIAAIFQTAPAFLSELFLPVTVLSTIPVYCISRIKPAAGICTFISAALLIFLISPHESFFFLCTNGIVGLSLGICRYYTERKLVITLVTSLVLSLALCFANFIFGIKVLGTEIPGPIWIQAAVIWMTAAIYAFLVMHISNYIFSKLQKVLFRLYM